MDPKEAKIYLTLLIAAVIVGVIISFFIISLIRHQRRNLQLHKEKIQAEIITLERERKRMASDLHDELGPVLSAVKMQINSVDVSDEDEELIEKASKHLDNSLQRIREISNNLMPVALVRKGFVTALNEYVDNINRTGKLSIQYNSSTGDLLIDKDKEIHLYRIAQEIIHNAIKHSGGSTMKIQIAKKQDMVILEISDNGKGFDQVSVSKGSVGHGLGNILSRVEILQGDVYVDTAAGKGVKYNIEIPA
ncbi:sensor histidine kinase [Aridibaculum aurantiacum]|uniref:sensor histidine kinase n=1 Tax=Aridibaculum aurantiacum TaxID=2810307 RepID=UPI001A969C0F|nr:sensor histidine kinase [Aridibaculum aurantiacum]